MKFAMNFAEALAGDVGVKFGGADAAVAEEFLDDAQVGAVFQEMGCETVAKHVRRDVAGDAGVARAGFDAAPHGRSAEGAAAFGEEKVSGGFWADLFWAAGFEVTIDRGDGVMADGDDAFFVAFADDREEASVEVKVLNAQAAKFGQTQAAGISDFKNGLVAKCIGGFGNERREELADFGVAQSFGKAFPTAGQAQIFGDVVGKETFGFAEF